METNLTLIILYITSVNIQQKNHQYVNGQDHVLKNVKNTFLVLHFFYIDFSFVSNLGSTSRFDDITDWCTGKQCLGIDLSTNHTDTSHVARWSASLVAHP